MATSTPFKSNKIVPNEAYLAIDKPPKWEKAKFDLPLIFCITLLLGYAAIILYSASGQNMSTLLRQTTHIGLSIIAFFISAHISPQQYCRWAKWLYGIGCIFLLIVLCLGYTSKGAQRWLDLHFFRFQPSEMMKLAVPMMVAFYLNDKPLPISGRTLFNAFILVIVPSLMIAKQPDLGTSLLITASGCFVIFFAGISWRFISLLTTSAIIGTPLLWLFLHDYQKKRVLTFLNPENDPLGAGYHIIQSKIALGSGGLTGKGWLHGTQSHLNFLPEHKTDFIFSVLGEEFGFLGILILFALYAAIIYRGLLIGLRAQKTFSRLLANSITMTFFVYFIVNVGMVSGLLPVVGLPLPLVSYGGTSLLTLMAGFGILMSIHTDKKWLSP